MLTATCSACNNSFNKSETFEVCGRTLCGPCGEEFIKSIDQNAIKDGDIVRNLDPTVCAFCNVDQGDLALPMSVANLPTCEPCDRRMRNFPYPTWVKTSFAGLVVLAIAAFAGNWRFVSALWSVRQASRALDAHDVSLAADRWEQAAASVPEEKYLGDQAALWRGIVLLNEDRSAEALPKLERAAAALPDYEVAKTALSAAQMAVAFDKHDYNTMVTLAREHKEKASREWMSPLSLASALACRYADQGNAADRDASLRELDEGMQMAGDDDAAKLYENRIRHRLHTRNVITPAEFEKQFPNGWKSEGEAAPADPNAHRVEEPPAS